MESNVLRLVPSLRVQREPVLHSMSTRTPLLVEVKRAPQTDLFDLAVEDGAGSG